MAMKTAKAGNEDFDDLDLMTEGELATKIKMTPGAVRNARMRGTLGFPFIKLGQGKKARIRYRRTVVSKILDARTFANTREAQGAKAEEGL
jgi:hypothetical protein